jgi:SRSO17 transposase
VACCDAGCQPTGSVAVRLSLPKSWADDPVRRPQARVPTATSFQTTPEMALARLDHARAWGGPSRCVVADADDGDRPHVLAGLAARQAPDVAAVRTDFAVQLRHAATSSVWRADERLQTVPHRQWRTVRWRRGPRRKYGSQVDDGHMPAPYLQRPPWQGTSRPTCPRPHGSTKNSPTP